MTKKDLIKSFIDKKYSTPPRKNNPSNKIFHNHFDEIWSIDLADMTVTKFQITKDLNIYLYFLIIF